MSVCTCAREVQSPHTYTRVQKPCLQDTVEAKCCNWDIRRAYPHDALVVEVNFLLLLLQHVQHLDRLMENEWTDDWMDGWMDG